MNYGTTKKIREFLVLSPLYRAVFAHCWRGHPHTQMSKSSSSWLQPGARLENLLPSFSGSAPLGKAEGRSRHVPQSHGEWENPTSPSSLARKSTIGRVVDAEFTVRLGMPVTSGEASRNTDERLPAFTSRGLQRRGLLSKEQILNGETPQPFSAAASPVFKMQSSPKFVDGFPVRSSNPIHGGGQGEKRGTESTLEEPLKPVRMHPFFSGVHDPLVDYSLQVDVPVQAVFRCIAPATNFDLFELDRTTNNSTWHSIEPTTIQRQDGSKTTSLTDAIRINLGSIPVKMTKVRSLMVRCAPKLRFLLCIGSVRLLGMGSRCVQELWWN